MCEVCDMLDNAAGNSSDALKLRTRVMASLDRETALSSGLELRDRFSIPIDDAQAKTLYMSGVVSGVTTACVILLDAIRSRGRLTMAARATMREMQDIPGTYDMLVDLNTVLRTDAEEQVRAVLRSMDERAQEHGIEAAVAEARVPIESMVPEQFVAIARRAVDGGDSAVATVLAAYQRTGLSHEAALEKYGRFLVTLHTDARAQIADLGQKYIDNVSDDFLNVVDAAGL